MKKLSEITNIVIKMPNETFNKINKANGDYFFGVSKEKRNNGYKRLVYNLKKCGLTLEEWELWANN